MRVGILTLKLHSNFGFLMQSYALQKVVKTMGHEPFHFYIKEEPLSLVQKIEILIKKIIKNIFRGANYQLFPYYPTIEDMAVKDRNTWDFIHKHLSLTPYISSLITEQIYNIPQYDSYIVGSDQVWRREFTDDIRCYYFNFVAEKKRRMSYAASFGTNTLSYNKKRLNECGKLLKKFDVVTVREDDGIRICKEYFGCNAVKVLDPTLLLTESDYSQLIDTEETPLNNEAYIFIYILRPTKDKLKFVQQFAKDKNLKIIDIMPAKFEQVGRKKLKDCIYPTISSWLNGFKNADYVLTDSFHASVFSIIFHKQFYVIKDKFGGITRISSLLNMLGLEGRYSSEYKPNSADIDYHIVEEKLLIQREKSMLILNNFLSQK